MGKGVYRVPGKAADGFCDDHINFSCHTVINHCLKVIPLTGHGSALPVICIDSCKHPFRVAVDFFCIIIHLCFIAGLLLFLQGTDSAVGGYPQPLILGPCITAVFRIGWNYRDIFLYNGCCSGPSHPVSSLLLLP